MKVRIDGAGRVIVPKVLRDQLNLEAGTRLDIRARGGILEIEPEVSPMRLVRRGGNLVATGEDQLPTLDADDVRAVTESLRR